MWIFVQFRSIDIVKNGKVAAERLRPIRMNKLTHLKNVSKDYWKQMHIICDMAVEKKQVLEAQW